MSSSDPPHDEARRDVPPGEPPQTQPTSTPMMDYSFTLQAVMELQKSVGELTGTMKYLKESVDGQGRKLNLILSAFLVATGGGSVIFWIVDKRFDVIAKLIGGP